MPREKKPAPVALLDDKRHWREDDGEIASGPVSEAASLVRTAAGLRRKGKCVSVVLRQDIRWRPDKWEWEQEYLVDDERKGNGSLPFFTEAEADGFTLAMRLAGATRIRKYCIRDMGNGYGCWRVRFRMPQVEG